VRRPYAGARTGAARATPRDPRPLPGRHHGGLRPAFPALDGPAPQGRRRQRGLHAAAVRRRGRPGGARRALQLRRPESGAGARQLAAAEDRGTTHVRSTARRASGAPLARPAMNAPARAKTAVSIRRPGAVDPGVEAIRAKDPVTLVIFGASGDLAKRKLIPA